jgi:guanyl-specific ribonuclease Sa
MDGNSHRSGTPAWRPRGWSRLVLVLVVLAVGSYFGWQEQQREREKRRPQENVPAQARRESLPKDAEERSEALPDRLPGNGTEPGSDRERTDAGPRSETASSTTIRNQVIRGLDGKVAYEGDIDVGPTIERIRAGRLLDFSNDGTTFQNRERRLPRKPAGYYKEYVHPTPGLRGPGPQRIVAGQEGEFYYTADHYGTFKRIEQP